MSLRILITLFALAIAGCSTTEPQPVRLDNANVLPLAIDPDFQIRKIKRYFFEPETFEVTTSEPANFERRYFSWGAVDRIEIDQRRGNYMDIFWRTKNEADVTVRLEYRQVGLGNTVSAQELYFPATRGSRKSTFRVVGDEYLEFGRISSWRVLLIVEGRIVALRQSFLWR